MDINSSGSTILYLWLAIISPQRECLSVINTDTTVLPVLDFYVINLEDLLQCNCNVMQSLPSGSYGLRN